MTTFMRRRGCLLASMAAAWLAACSAPAPTPAPSAPAPARAPATPAPAAAIPPATAANPLRLAPRDPTLEAWKVSAAQRIHAANSNKLFEGPPHLLLKAVIVVEATVDKSGNVVSSKVTRSPKIASLDTMALNSLKAASPLPPPPPALLSKGVLVYSETWLVQNNETFRVRTLSLPHQ